MTPGRLGGHRRGRIYGRLDCPSALRAIRRGGYVANRVFFADEATAVGAGYRPCAVCLPQEYQSWKALGAHSGPSTSSMSASRSSVSRISIRARSSKRKWDSMIAAMPSM